MPPSPRSSERSNGSRCHAQVRSGTAISVKQAVSPAGSVSPSSNWMTFMPLSNQALFMIERNLNRNLSLGELAKFCGVSRFHLAHAFGEMTGFSVMEYVRRRRLSSAACALASGAADILDVALEAGYNSHEAFSRAFKVEFGTTPDQVRTAESTDGLMLLEPLKPKERPAIKLGPPRFENVAELRFVGLSEPCRYVETQNIPSQWQRFMAGPYAAIEHKTKSIPVGISMPAQVDGVHDYVCAAEVSRFGEIPQGLSKVTSSPAQYAVFAHDDHITTLHTTYVAIWNDWFPASGKTPAEAPGFERHNSTFDTRTGSGGVTIWIPLVP
jgi:AraC family transcriptional regulator